MPALFPEWSNTALKLALVALAMLVLAAITAPMIYVRTPYNTYQFHPVDQPVEFDHRHHAGDDGIDCLYCHSEAESSPTAGVPSTDVCMGCHNQIWNESPLLAPVRQSYFTGLPIRWNRVHRLPDFAYFDHSVHVQGGVGCASCHGLIERAARVYRAAPLTMKWCLDCHRDPRRHTRSPEVAEYGSTWGATVEGLAPDVPTGRALTRLTTCSACHR